ncbi:MAG: phosphate-starvation-inducible PsiE family protein [Burkholderiaceae bacterium]|nr:phosphate-starvation-inducible PsiE family protein [Burkholderiaceae bacterium]
MTQPKSRLLAHLRLLWKPIHFHEKFEKIVAGILSIAIAIIIVVSLIQLLRTIYVMLVLDAMNPLDHTVFQAVFGMIMTLLIAMEFQHSIVRMAVRGDSLIQVKTVLLIGLIALARKFVILDPADTGPAKMAALSGATIALGVVYWLLRERDDRQAANLTKNNTDE